MIAKIILAIAMVVVGGTVVAEADLAEFNAINAAARAARERGENAALLANMRKLAAIVPGHPAVEIALARAMAANGDSAGALAQLKRIADLGFSFKAFDDAAFQKMKDDSGFVAVAQRLAVNGKGLGRGKGVIKLGLPGGSEGVAFSETTSSFLMGSSGSIYSYKLDGKDAAKPIAKAGGTQILGIRPDPASRSFLVCVDEAEGSNAAVVRHNESSGEIEASYKLPTKNAYCNDIALLKNGSFAVTDSNNGIVFDLVDGKLEPLALAVPLYYPNGIASDLDKNRLYVTHAGGVVVHDMATGKSRELAVTGTFIGALDGMVWHKGSLVAVQNPRDAAIRLLRITPDADAQTAKVEVLLVGTDFPGHASTVAIAGDEAFVIGTSGEREEPVLIRAPLQKDFTEGRKGHKGPQKKTCAFTLYPSFPNSFWEHICLPAVAFAQEGLRNSVSRPGQQSCGDTGAPKQSLGTRNVILSLSKDL